MADMPLRFSGMRQTRHESRHIHRPRFRSRGLNTCPRSVLAQADAAARAGMDSSLTVGDRHSLAPAAYLQNVPLTAP